jgi:deoxyribonuclease V
MEIKASSLIPFAKSLQMRLLDLFVDSQLSAKNIKVTLAVDSAYSERHVFTCAVMFDLKANKVVRKWRIKDDVCFPYIPGYLFMREAPPIVHLLSKINEDYDLLLVDAHGRLHPRRAGLATTVGILMRKPTLGIAKSLLVGSVNEGKMLEPVTLKGELLGYRINSFGSIFYVSQGNMISLKESLEFLKIRNYRYPEEMKVADAETKKFKRSS